MTTALVLGSAGFVGRHLVEALGRREGVRVLTAVHSTSREELARSLSEADCVFHVAGVNRPADAAEFATGNAEFTRWVCSALTASTLRPTIVFSSSIQAGLNNPYGRSKRAAEEILETWANTSGGRAAIFRLPNVFGKWSRPNYNSVVATFCHNLARGLPISISEPSRELELVYIDDVVDAFLAVMNGAGDGGSLCRFREVPRSYRLRLGELAARLQDIADSRRTLVVPPVADELTRRLLATFLSHLEPAGFAYDLEQRSDGRGTLAEFVKSAPFGQVFVSHTKPGVTRGNHFHHTKVEKFFVVAGDAVIRFRSIMPRPGSSPGPDRAAAAIIEHRVSGHQFRVIDIPPGYAHSIENVGAGDLVTIFWASEIFDPGRPDVYPAPVLVSP